jgi:hypothetical protein
MKEQKTININFRVSERYRVYLEMLTAWEGNSSISEFLNAQIMYKTREMIQGKAFLEAIRKTAPEFGIPAHVAAVIKKPDEVKEMMDKEKFKKFTLQWAYAYEAAFERIKSEIGFQDEAEIDIVTDGE